MKQFFYILPLPFFLLSCSNQAGQESIENNSDEIIIQIDAADKRCEMDADCVNVMTQCSCDCGEAVNEDNLQKYLDRKEMACKHYEGPLCDMSCPSAPKCVNNVCTLAS